MAKISPDLIKQLVKKQPEAYNIFYLQTVDIFYRYLMSRYFLSEQDAEDILSNFYVKFWRVVPRYDTQYAFETYMWTIFRNIIKDYFKQQQNISFVDDMVVTEKDTGEEDMLELMEQNFQLEDIKEAMQQLDTGSYEVLFFKFIEEYSHQEIADELGLSVDAVRQRISRGIRRLKILLEKNTNN